MRRPFLAAACAACLAVAAPADEKLAGIACRSVHLGYPAGAGTAFLNELTVEASAPGTYFCACGWDKGYFGVQELADGKKLALFSVWDSAQDDPKAVAEGRRVKVVHRGEKVRIGRFGGEGTGGQAFLDLDWKAGDTYRFLVTARPDGDRTEYAGYLRGPATDGWRHLVTFSTVTGGKPLAGYYSFVEDFKRDRASATKARAARYGNTWVKTAAGWAAVTEVRFTADRNPATNINAGVKDGRFFLATGGDTRNTDAKLDRPVRLPAGDRPAAPDDLPDTDRPRR